MRYQISAWEDSDSLERRIFEDDKGNQIYLDIAWSDATFFVNSENFPEEHPNKLGIPISTMDGFEVDDYTDGNAELNFPEGQFSTTEINHITASWEERGDDVLEEMGFSEKNSEWYISSEIRCYEVEEDDENEED